MEKKFLPFLKLSFRQLQFIHDLNYLGIEGIFCLPKVKVNYWVRVNLSTRDSFANGPFRQEQTGGTWNLVSGLKEGQTQVDSPQWEEMTVWSHPIDLHFSTRGLHGWPRILVQVYHQDQFGRNDLIGYGLCHIPMTPGHHDLEIMTWKPVGNFRETLTQHHLGGSVQLRNPELTVSSSDRYRLTSRATGKVCLKLGVVFRNFDKFQVEFG